MAGPAVGRSVKNKDAGGTHARSLSSTRPVARSAPDDILYLQRTAGNRVVQSLLHGDQGQPLDRSVRAEMESRFGHDFGRVRVHTGSQATAMATSLAARAYTVGDHIVFNAGHYAPDSLDGRRLLAHELAHVIQQRRGGPSPGWGLHSSDEAEAGNIADAVAAGRMAQPIVSGTAIGVARQTMDPRHARGHAGEQGMGFEHYAASGGWVIVDGPSGSAGHGVTTSGFDAVAYNTRTDRLDLADNKSLKASTVSSATAITTNLLKNLDATIQRITAAKDMRYRIRVLELLRATRAAVRGGRPLPSRVSLVVTASGGRSTGISRRLQSMGVRFQPAPAPAPAPSGAPPAASPAAVKPPAAQKPPAASKPPASKPAPPQARPPRQTKPPERGKLTAAVPPPARQGTPAMPREAIGGGAVLALNTILAILEHFAEKKQRERAEAEWNRQWPEIQKAISATGRGVIVYFEYTKDRHGNVLIFERIHWHTGGPHERPPGAVRGPGQTPTFTSTYVAPTGEQAAKTDETALEARRHELWRKQKIVQRVGESMAKEGAVGRALRERAQDSIDVTPAYDARSHLVSAGVAIKQKRYGAAAASLDLAEQRIKQMRDDIDAYRGRLRLKGGLVRASTLATGLEED